MKKVIIYSILVWGMSLNLQAQTALSDKNYVHTSVPQEPVTINDIENVSCSNINDPRNTIENVTYFDGLGRPLQQRAINASPNGEDIVTHIKYDDYGRQDKQYLPFVSSTNGSFQAVDINNDINSYYVNKYAADFVGITNPTEVNAYSESSFEPSPLNRVLEQGAPGKDWKVDAQSNADHTIKFDWKTNTANEAVLFKVSFPDTYNTHIPSLQQNGFYAANQLYVTVIKDENWQETDGNNHTTKEYKDKLGRVVLKRAYASTSSATAEAHDTYYVYDDFGNLTYVIPPKVDITDSVSDTELSELCYQYKYDKRNRLIEKKIPGKEWEYIVYNKLDQPILTQDPNLKAKTQWLFTKYDVFGRVVYTGMRGSGANRATLQNSWANRDTYKQFETSQTTPFAFSNTQVYYSRKDAYPTSYSAIYTINYYDDYRFLATEDAVFANPGTVMGQAVANNAKTLPTGTKIRVLETNPIQWITTVTYYDKKSRPIYIVSKNEFLNTVDITETKYDFVGRVEKTKTTHTKGSNAAIVTEDMFQYDHMGRLTQQTQKINNQDTEQIVANTYDELGQLVKKNVGGVAPSTEATRSAGLQTVDYTYNIRGWLKGINDVDNIGNDLFAFRINYNTTTENLGAYALYNGNISETIWKTANDDTRRGYGYGYDKLNRLIRATQSDGNYNVAGITYDKLGNIKSLNRNGHTNTNGTTFGAMDRLTYTYDAGNKLQKVADTGNKTYGFKDGTNTNDDFEYDDNGNMTIDRNKGISSITYNHLNLPQTVSISNSEGTGTISYIYDATGAKQKKIVTEGSSLTTEYAGNYVYKNGNLEFFNHPEGIVEKEGDGYKYVYQFKDHLDNIRLSYSDKDGNGNITTAEIIQKKHYYPFGLQHRYGGSDPRSAINGRNHNYGYNGIEQEESLGIDWYEMDLRKYDPAIARWNGIDPVTHHSMSTYNAFDNNPVYWADPSGADSTSFGADGLTNEQWVSMSRPGGGGFDAMRQQSRLNFFEEANNNTDPKKKKKSTVITGDLEMESVERPELPDFIMAMLADGGYTSSFIGTIEEYNALYGTDYQAGDIGLWYYDNYYSIELSQLRGSIQAAQGEAAEYVMYIMPTGPGAAVGVKGGRLAFKGLSKAYKFVDNTLVFAQNATNVALHRNKLNLIGKSYGVYNGFSKGIRRKLFPMQKILHKERNIFRNYLNPKLPDKINGVYTNIKRIGHFFN